MLGNRTEPGRFGPVFQSLAALPFADAEPGRTVERADIAAAVGGFQAARTLRRTGTAPLATALAAARSGAALILALALLFEATARLGCHRSSASAAWQQQRRDPGRSGVTPGHHRCSNPAHQRIEPRIVHNVCYS